MSTIFTSDSCWKIEKTNIGNDSYCYSFVCPCLFKFEFTQSLFDSGLIHQRFLEFDKMIYPKTSLWAIFRKDVYYHAVLLSEEVLESDVNKMKKYMKALDSENKNDVYKVRAHNFSRIYDSSTNQPLPRSLTPLLLCYFGDTSSVNSKCLHLTSIYNTLAELTLLHNEMIIKPDFLKHMTVDYIDPVVPNILINYSHIHPGFYIIALGFIAGFITALQRKGSPRVNTRHTIIAWTMSIVLGVILYIICKKLIITGLIDKTFEIMVDYNKNYHMKCHDSCNSTFEPNLSYNFDAQLVTLKDNKSNNLDGKAFNNNDYKTHNQMLLQKSIKLSKDECTYNCVNEEVILVNKIYNEIPYYQLKKDYVLQLNSFNHVFFIGNGDESQKQYYRDLITRYFTFSFIF
jgi:hypothetical protein